MLRKFILLCFACQAFATNYMLKEYKIPGTKAKVQIPAELNECMNLKNTINLCTPEHNADLIIKLYSNITAKDNFLSDYYSQKANRVKFYGARKIKDKYWLDFVSLASFNGRQNRYFAVYKQLNKHTSIKLIYSLFNARISGYTLLRYQASLDSLKIG